MKRPIEPTPVHDMHDGPQWALWLTLIIKALVMALLVGALAGYGMGLFANYMDAVHPVPTAQSPR